MMRSIRLAFIRLFRSELVAVCTCGDWVDDHYSGVGKCMICSESQIAELRCTGYRYFAHERRRRTRNARSEKPQNPTDAGSKS